VGDIPDVILMGAEMEKQTHTVHAFRSCNPAHWSSCWWFVSGFLGRLVCCAMAMQGLEECLRGVDSSSPRWMLCQNPSRVKWQFLFSDRRIWSPLLRKARPGSTLVSKHDHHDHHYQSTTTFTSTCTFSLIHQFT
jgi:hypothetical protein